MQGPQIESGYFTGAGAAKTIELGFKPRGISVFNPAATTTELAEMHWFEGQSETAGAGMSRNAAGASAPLTTTGIKLVTTGSVQTSDPVQITGAYGFTIPAGMNINADVIFWRAFR